MTDYTVSRLGEVNTAGGSVTELFLKVFPGEVMGAFRETNVMMPLHVTRTITSGKSATFPATGKSSATYHTPGTTLIGAQRINHNERIISIDSLLVADTFVAEIDEAMNHFDVRGEYAAQLGQALAKTADENLLQVAVLTARSSATVTGISGGSAVTHANAKTDGEQLASLIFDAAQAFDEKDVPENDRYVAMRPAQFYLAVQSTKLLNKDWGGEGSFANAKLPVVAGMKVVKTNNLPITSISATTGENNTYNGDFSKTAAVAWDRRAVGTVQLIGLKMEKEYKIELQGTLMVAKYAMGHGILRPECAVEIATP